MEFLRLRVSLRAQRAQRALILLHILDLLVSCGFSAICDSMLHSREVRECREPGEKSAGRSGRYGRTLITEDEGGRED